MRLPRGLLPATVVVLALLAGCSGRTPSRPATTESTSASGCVGHAGDEHLLQGQPHDLPDGSGVGIGSVDLDAEPPTVRLVLAGVPTDQSAQDNDLSVGDTIEIGPSTYELVQICASSVDLALTS